MSRDAHQLTHRRWIPVLMLSALLLNGCSLQTMYSFNENADRSLLPKEGPNGKWGYVDAHTGKFVIEPKFDHAAKFTDDFFDKHDGLAPVIYHGKNCYTDKSGSIITGQ